ncbi:DNA polymerase III, epsilon subunit [secondary endosymbiont of Heteropsylla cubana]|uniref:DNA polymerase III subunit epsilon n=1 Tax=secondary endosymbiont of Heteropsylla cubana TaxID=134287 RepID=J3TGS7_9ENTR|nr:DNA polymerase III subunit epsilon [secondary endosymbiont of Heteropsylla cubana]AFP85712.1 DNA polymerase III, epsilon subunit [secondary endosymbiont of Heteropsylla cubana]
MNTENIRQVVMDTETTGMNKSGPHYKDHRIIEIGAVEVINRRLSGQYFHVYLQPDRLIEQEAFTIHGISDKFLADKPTFSDIADKFLDFIHGAELIIHNAPFDVGFIDYEFSLLNRGIPKIHTYCKITDSLLIARKIFPGKRNNLDALCDRYLINKSKRAHHGALLDAEILADIFLLMTGGQTTMLFTEDKTLLNIEEKTKEKPVFRHLEALKVIYPTKEELFLHEQKLNQLQKKAGKCIWRIEKPKKNNM